jgi:hypothetical protein
MCWLILISEWQEIPVLASGCIILYLVGGHDVTVISDMTRVLSQPLNVKNRTLDG